MNKFILYITCVLLFLSLIAACDLYNDNNYREYVVVESYLIANRNLPVVRLSTTLPADEEYSFNNAAISNAEMTIHLLSEGGEVQESFPYDMTQPGVYISESEHTILPRRTYVLEAEVPGHGHIGARTTIPETFQIIGEIPDTITYQSAIQLEFTISKNVNPGRQNVYVFNTIAVEPEYDNLTPFYRSIIDDNGDNEMSDFSNNPSNLINEGNFTVNPDGSIQLRFPWLAVAFYGKNRIVTNSIENNIFDFVRSQEVQLGGSTLSPGEIPNAIYHIEGGIGVFGGISADTISTYIQRPY